MSVMKKQLETEQNQTLERDLIEFYKKKRRLQYPSGFKYQRQTQRIRRLSR
jgi:hypothetical protein